MTPEELLDRTSCVSVLIADHDESVRHRLAEPMARHTVYTARSPGEVREILHSETVDIVLLALDLPGAAGYELLDEIDAIDGGPLVVGMSADPMTAKNATCRGDAVGWIKRDSTYHLLGDFVARAVRVFREPVER